MARNLFAPLHMTWSRLSLQMHWQDLTRHGLLSCPIVYSIRSWSLLLIFPSNPSLQTWLTVISESPAKWLFDFPSRNTGRNEKQLDKLTVSWGHQYPATNFPLHFALKPLTNIFDNANMFAVSQSWCLIPSLPFWFKKLQLSLTWEFMMQQKYLAREQTQSNSPHFSHKACLVASCSQTFSANPATSPASFQNAIAGLRQHL